MINNYQRLKINRLNPINILKSLKQSYDWKKFSCNNLDEKEITLSPTFDLELAPPKQKGENWENRSDRTLSIIPEILDILEKTNSTATFFVEGIIAQKKPELIEEIYSKGHEIGSHGFNHKSYNKKWKTDYGTVKGLKRKEKKDRIEKTTKLLNKVSEKPISFRAPYLNIDNETINLLEKYEYETDSSLYNMVWGKKSTPYTPSKNHLHKKGNRDIIESPLTVVPTPIVPKAPNFPTFISFSQMLFRSKLEKNLRVIDYLSSQGKEKNIIINLGFHPHDFYNKPKNLKKLKNLLNKIRGFKLKKSTKFH